MITIEAAVLSCIRTLTTEYTVHRGRTPGFLDLDDLGG
jgi:hypothetical protein